MYNSIFGRSALLGNNYELRITIITLNYLKSRALLQS